MNNKIRFAAVYFICAWTSAAAFEVDLDQGGAIWNFDRLSAEVIDGALRLRETGEQTRGSASIRIPVQGAKYLQIVAGASEEPQHYMTASDESKKLMPEGCIFQGCNTFPLPDRDFPLVLCLYGPRGSEPGGWYDIKAVRTVSVPTGGLTVSAEKQVVKVGDSFLVRYYGEPGSGLPSVLPVQVFFGTNMAPVTFGKPIELRDDGKNGDQEANDGIYSARVTVTEEASCLQSEKNGPLPGGTLCFSVRLSDGSASYGTANFSFDIATKNRIQKTETRLTPTAAEYRDRWTKALKGKVNLAEGKPVDFSVAPNFWLTVGKNNTDRFDLTDGKLSSRGDDVLRFDPCAVGWRTGEDLSNGIDLVVDLGKVEPVEKVVIRINGGDSQNQIQRSPHSLSVLVSRDGELYYPAAPPLIKLEPGDRDQSDFKQRFYLEEKDEIIFCYPFELAVSAQARYVMVRIVPDGGNLYCDELVILKAEGAVSDEAYRKAPEKRLSDCCILEPSFQGNFYIADNIAAPNYLKIRDLRKDKKNAPMKLAVEVPEGILCTNAEAVSESIVRDGSPYTRITVDLPEKPRARTARMEYRPLFLQAPRGMKNPGKAFFYLIVDGTPSHVAEREITILSMPESTAAFRGLTALSRGSVTDNAWPGLLENLRKLNFTGVQIYPYLFMRGGKDDFSPEYLAGVEAARRAGFKIIVCFNGLTEMYNKWNNPGEDVWCQTNQPKHNPCPSFRGREYQGELDKIIRSVVMFKPDCIQWDIEHWGDALQGMRSCTRCQNGWKKSGKSWREYLDDLSVELNRDLTDAVAKGARQAGIPMPDIYNYNRQALTLNYLGFEKWELNKQFVTGSHPALYVAGSELRVHNTVKGNFDLQDDKSARVILPILTPGTYGPYEPYHLEQMIYEVMLNGARGFFYYPWWGFISPIYFYYHAEAMRNMVRHQDLIFTGEIFTPRCDRAEMTLSGVRNSDEALILIGNYRGAEENCAVEAPFAEATVTDVQTGRKLSDDEVKNLHVPRHRVRLLHWERSEKKR